MDTKLFECMTQMNEIIDGERVPSHKEYLARVK